MQRGCILREPHQEARKFPGFCSTKRAYESHLPAQARAISSVVERSVHIGKVAGSITALPTIESYDIIGLNWIVQNRKRTRRKTRLLRKLELRAGRLA